MSKRRYSLQYEGQEIASWRCVPGWHPYYGSILAVQYKGRLTIFRALAQDGDVITIDLV